MGFKIREFPYEMRVGRDLTSVPNLSQAIKDQENDFDFILVDTCHASNFRTESTISTRDIALTRSGMHLYHSSLKISFLYRYQHKK